MSRSSKGYGRGKGGGAGLKFDTLLKACSNSKKLTANKTAGALGRFGIASFTSVRNTNLDTSEGEQQQESRFSFTKKKPKLSNPVIDNTLPVQNPYMSVPLPSYSSSPYTPISHVPPVIAKPRKFFKSRDPSAADSSGVACSTSERRETSHSVAPIKIPVIKPDKTKGKSASPEKSSKPLRTANNTSPSNAQPIKLRIFKDKATSKLMSEAPPPLLSAEASPRSNQKLGSKDDKIPKKRGRKPKSFYAGNDLPAPLEPQAAPAPATKKSGRSTRNSRKNESNTNTQQEILQPLPLQQLHRNSDSSIESMPILTRAHMEEASASENSNLYSPNPCAYGVLNVNGNLENRGQPNLAAFPPVMPRKIEEDAEFQQLSQMLSSMEDGDNNYSQNPNYGHLSAEAPAIPHHTVTHHNYQAQNAHLLQHQAVVPQATQHFPYESEMYPEYTNEPISSIPQVDQRTLCSVPRSSSSPPMADTTETSRSPSRDPRDIRAILEDDWDESFDEESPKKSPPKTSRFDLSAFMPDGSGSHESTSSSPNLPGVYPSVSQPAPPVSTHGPTPHTIAGMIGVPEYSQSAYPQLNYQQQPSYLSHTNQYMDPSGNPSQHQHVSHFNAPYAVRNLLSSPAEFQAQAHINAGNPVYSHGLPTSAHCVPNAHERASLKPESMEVDKSTEALNLSVSTSSCTVEGATMLAQNLQALSSQELPTSRPVSSAPKKGSIFKSRAQNNGDPSKEGSQGNPKKRLALYKHKFGQGDGDEDSKLAGEDVRGRTPGQDLAPAPDEFDEDSDPEDLASMRRVASTDAYGDAGNGFKVVCKKNSKKLYSVIRNVKPIHELQESGEFHEFDGDVMYILEELNDKNPLMNRCLSAITLAMRCMEPAFRMHLRAHGTVAEFCKELHDAPNNPILALLASTVLFVLSQDRLNMDLDTDSLKLIIALTKAQAIDSAVDENPELGKLRSRVLELVLEMKGRGHAKDLKVEKITASELALETLLYLTSKRAGEWVKHELRTLGGLDYIITEVVMSHSRLSMELQEVRFSENVIERLLKIDRCLRVLQQVTFNHEENQRYLLGIPNRKDEQIGQVESKRVEGTPSIFIELFKFCNDHLASLPKASEPAKVLNEVLFSVLRVLVNLSHDYRGIVLGSEILCDTPEFLPLCLHSVFHMSVYIQDEKIFDLLMHSLCMLLNLVEHSKDNRNAILASRVTQFDHAGIPVGEQLALDALVNMFLAKEKAAKQDEVSTDDILTKGTDSQRSQDSKNSSSSSSQNQNSQNPQDADTNSVQDTIDKLIQTAGKHMENSLIAAYVSLLLAYLVMDDPVSATTVRNSMPEGRYLPLMVVLKKLFNFMSITSSASGSLRGLKATAIALKFYAKCDPQSNEDLKKIIPD